MEENTNTQFNPENPEPFQPVQGPAIVSPAPPPQANQAPQNPQPQNTPYPSSVYPEPTSGQLQVGMSASQLGLHEPKSKLFDFNPKQLITKGVLGLVILGGIFAALVMTNIVALSEFKTVNYENSKGESYNLNFYSKHSFKNTKSGTRQLVSKVSKNEKFPVTLSISGGNNGLNGYERLKDCAGFSKVFDVQNDNLNQKISVCNAVNGNVDGQSAKGAVYVAGITHNDQVHIVTIGQDYADIDLSSQSGAQESLAKFGLDAYEEDIKSIVASIKI